MASTNHYQMEESSNGGLEETLKVEPHDEGKEVVLEDSEALEADADGKDSSSSGSSSDDEEAEPEKENLDKFEENEVVSNSVGIEPDVSLTEDTWVENSGDSDVAELESKETEEDISASLDETNKDSPAVTDLPINGLKDEPEQVFFAEDPSKVIGEETTNPDVTYVSAVAVDVVSKGIEETTLSSLSENCGAPSAAAEQGIREREIPISDNDAEESSGSGAPDLEYKDHVEDSMQASNVPLIETRDSGELVNKQEIPENTGNQSILSLNRRPLQPTSWKSCCGLFEVLRRSGR